MENPVTLDELLRAHDAMIRAEVDAAACDTERDYRNAREKRDKFETLKEKYEKRA